MAASLVPSGEAPDEPTKLTVVEEPTAASAASVLSRYEFETDRGNEGTKILLVEWDAAAPGTSSGATGNATGKSDLGDWEVAWEGKTHVLPIRDSDTDSGRMRRVYFLLPPGAHVPPLINITQKTAGGKAGPNVLRAKPMPAIFPEELMADGSQSGKRGVLHTIWAKKRLSELDAEIAAELRTNSESIAIEMAVKEREWIVNHFGLADRAAGGKESNGVLLGSSPASPRSPIGGRLGEKLKGLKLATSPAELAAATQASKTNPITSLSPNTADMAVSSFASFGGRKASAVLGGGDGVASLDAIMGAGGSKPAAPFGSQQAQDTEEDLFALPMSPRSPEMKRSPFSLL